MKKLIGFITAAALSVSAMGLISVSAEDNTLIGYAVDNGVYVEYPSENNGRAVLNIYEENLLVYSVGAAKENGGYFFDIPDGRFGGRMKIYCVGDGIYEVSLTEYDAVSSATEKVEPSASPQSTEPAATETPTRTPYPEVYEKALDAVNAPAVIEQVSERIIDGETYYATEMLYQGEEITTNIRDWVTIDSAPSRRSDLTGLNANALQEGDVIHFTTDLQHRIKSIDLIYRPDFDDYVHSGGDYGSKYSKLIGKDRYSTFTFGVPVKTAKGYILIADVNGKTTEVDVSSKAFVYSVSRNPRGGRCELAGTGAGAVNKVYVQNSNFDGNENVISWDDIDVTSYVLARIVKGEATEVIVFEY